MKELLTFIYGILLFIGGVILVNACKDDFGWNLHLIQGLLGFVFLWKSLDKFDKSTL